MRAAVNDVFPSLAVIVADTELETADVVIAKDADVAPAAIVTLAGVAALVMLDERLTTEPPEGAGPLSLTVPVDEVPPTTEVGVTESPLRVTGLMVKDAVTVDVPITPLIVDVVKLATERVVTVKVADVEPDGTVTDEGVLALALLDDKVTTVPPGPAGPFKLNVPVDDDPPVTVVGERVRPSSPAGLILKVSEPLLPPRVAVIEAVTVVETAVVVTVNVVEVAPAATTTVDGKVASELFVDKSMVRPPVGAGPFRVTVTVAGFPPITVVGLIVMPMIEGGVTVKVAVCD